MKVLFTALLVCTSISLIAQSEVTLSGSVKTEEGESLPFATIYVKELSTGTTTNEDGYYSINLKPGKYAITFQYLGYEAQAIDLALTTNTQKDIVLLSQAIQLRDVQVKASREDPAFTIIRKAIAKAKYHSLQVESYTKKVYIKGGGRIVDAPFYLRKLLAKEGVDSSTVFVSESISEITYTMPNQYDEKVLHFRMIGNDSANINVMNYVNTSFYDPNVAESISPLSPRALGYYKFKYEGSFRENGVEISKIQVTPRVRADDVFFGHIYIIEGLWAIHSLDLSVYKMGFRIDLAQMYAPVQEGVWLPVSHKYFAEGSFWGFDLELNYLATASDYQVVLNPDLEQVALEVVDEKVQKELAKIIDKEQDIQKQLSETDAPKVLKSQQRMTRKDLRKTLRQYEKEVEKQEEEPAVASFTTYKVDSLAANADSVFWAKVRPVPLSRLEKMSYQKNDSIASVQAEEEDADGEKSSTKKKKSKFGFSDLLLGSSYQVGKKGRFDLGSALTNIQYNTVEGYNTILPLSYRHRYSPARQIKFTNTIRYGFGSDTWANKLRFEYNWKKTNQPIESSNGLWYLEGGRYINQINNDNPISQTLNTISTFLFEENFMKIYQKDYLQIGFEQPLNDKLRLNAHAQLADRNPLTNLENTASWIDRKSREYTPNIPTNIELDPTSFVQHRAMTGQIGFSYLPSLKFSQYNGKKAIIPNSSPLFKLDYHFGLPDVVDSKVDFGRIELGFQHEWKLGVRGKIHTNLYGGAFTHTRYTEFMDYKHFPGNLTIFQSINPAGSFRLLDYYDFSTNEAYTGGHLNYQFRRFLLTQIFEVRMLAIRENIIFNYLQTANSPFYHEVGYSIDNIFRLLRIEAIANFENGTYQTWGVRIGISTHLSGLISINRED